MYSAFDVACIIITAAQAQEKPVRNDTLQQILFLLNETYRKTYHHNLFNDPYTVEDHRIRYASVYYSLAIWGGDPITGPLCPLHEMEDDDMSYIRQFITPYLTIKPWNLHMLVVDALKQKEM